MKIVIGFTLVVSSLLSCTIIHTRSISSDTLVGRNFDWSKDDMRVNVIPKTKNSFVFGSEIKQLLPHLKNIGRESAGSYIWILQHLYIWHMKKMHVPSSLSLKFLHFLLLVWRKNDVTPINYQGAKILSNPLANLSKSPCKQSF